MNPISLPLPIFLSADKQNKGNMSCLIMAFFMPAFISSSASVLQVILPHRRHFGNLVATGAFLAVILTPRYLASEVVLCLLNDLMELSVVVVAFIDGGDRRRLELLRVLPNGFR